MLKSLRRFGKGERGFTLVELLVGIPITALVVGAATAGIIALLNSGDASTHMYALRQVQTAGYWVSTDGLQTDEVLYPVGTSDNVVVELTAPGDLLHLRWVDLDPGVQELYDVEYELIGTTGNLKLQRYEEVRDYNAPEGGLIRPAATTIVARYITHVKLWYEKNNPELIYFEVTATVGQGTDEEQTETRLYQIRPRSLEA